jgi:hypothetical protein
MVLWQENEWVSPALLPAATWIWPVPSPGLGTSAVRKWPISKARLKGEKLLMEVLGRVRGLVLGRRPGGSQDRKAAAMSATCHLDFQLLLYL